MLVDAQPRRLVVRRCSAPYKSIQYTHKLRTSPISSTSIKFLSRHLFIIYKHARSPTPHPCKTKSEILYPARLRSYQQWQQKNNNQPSPLGVDPAGSGPTPTVPQQAASGRVGRSASPGPTFSPRPAAAVQPVGVAGRSVVGQTDLSRNPTRTAHRA